MKFIIVYLALAAVLVAGALFFMAVPDWRPMIATAIVFGLAALLLWRALRD